jgi:hypothetical protein
LLLCDGLADATLDALTQFAQTHGPRRHHEVPKIVVFTQGYHKRKQQEVWRCGAEKVLSRAFECTPEHVKVLSFDKLEYTTVEYAEKLIKHCNIFHMAGGNAFDLADLWQQQLRLKKLLVDRVQQGEILYIGSSGGSFVAGNSLQYCTDAISHTGLGLGILDVNVCVHHTREQDSLTQNRTSTDKKSLILGPGTGAFINGDKVEPFFLKSARPAAQGACLISMRRAFAHAMPAPMEMTRSSNEKLLQAPGHHMWEGNSEHMFHVQLPVDNTTCPLVVIWLPGCGDPGDIKWGTLAKDLGRAAGPVADMIKQSCILVSPLCRDKIKNNQHRLALPAWYVPLCSAISKEAGGHVVVAGFSRGSRWGHEIVATICKDGFPGCYRALLLAPYCTKAWTVHERTQHAAQLKSSGAKIRCVYTKFDESCKWSTEESFITNAGESHDVSDLCINHSQVLERFLEGDFDEDVNWLLHAPCIEHDV